MKKMDVTSKDFRIGFMGVGAGKSATSWVAEILRMHPDIYYPMEEKELNYFNRIMPQDFKTKNYNNKKPLNWYHHYFRDAQEGQLTGEISPSYLAFEDCAKDIYKYNPNLKIFAIIRQPIERSFSQYKYSKQNGMGGFGTYEDAIDSKPYKFLHTSLYYENLKRYFDVFPKENVKVMFFDDVKKDSKAFLKELYDFLEVKEHYPELTDEKVNVGMQPKSQRFINIIARTKMFIHGNGMQFILPLLEKTGIADFVRFMKKKNMTKRQEQTEVLTDATKQRLNQYFLNDIESLEKMLDVDLTHWKNY